MNEIIEIQQAEMLQAINRSEIDIQDVRCIRGIYKIVKNNDKRLGKVV